MTLNIGQGKFRWDDNTGQSDPDKPVDVYYYRPEVITEETPVWMIMHGTGRNADDYRDYFIDEAKKQGALVIAPKFSARDWDGSTGYNLGNISASNSDLTPVQERDWSFSKIEPLFDYVVNEVEPKLNTDGYYMFGHSAGAQFVHRFMAWKPEARVKLAVAANAGWYTVPQSDESGYKYDWPYSTSQAPDYNSANNVYDPFPLDNLDNFLSSELVVLLGEEDRKRTSNLRQTKEADTQGRNRFERGQYFYVEGRDEAQARGVEFNWELQTVPGIGHEGDQMAIPAAELFRLDYLEEHQSNQTKLAWETQGLLDEAAVAPNSSFELGGGLTATVDWETETKDSSFVATGDAAEGKDGTFVAAGGNDFVSYEKGTRGGDTGYLNIGFDNEARDPNDLVRVSLRFSEAVAGLNFSVLDVDQGSYFDDAVVIYADGENILNNPNVSYSLGEIENNDVKVKLDNETYMKGFEGKGKAPSDSLGGNIHVALGSTSVSEITIEYFSTDDNLVHPNPHAQSIGISDLSWTAS